MVTRSSLKALLLEALLIALRWPVWIGLFIGPVMVVTFIRWNDRLDGSCTLKKAAILGTVIGFIAFGLLAIYIYRNPGVLRQPINVKQQMVSALLVFFTFVFTAITISLESVSLINIFLDEGPSQFYRVRVLKKQKHSDPEAGWLHSVTIAFEKESPVRIKQVTISAGTYDSLTPDSEIELVVGKGYLGCEWIRAIRDAPPVITFGNNSQLFLQHRYRVK